jgi:hypothetical protein
MRFDHVVYGVPDLKHAIQSFQEKAGIAPVIAGKHPLLGTHNAVLSLGNLQYLEFIALDPEAPKMERKLPSWCAALIHLSRPKIMTWVVQTDTIEKTVNELNALGNFHIDPPQTITREKPDGTKISFNIAFKKEPPPPDDGLIPFLINWGQSPHPSTSVECKCQLKEWYGCHPDADRISSILKKVGIEFLIKKADTPSMHLALKTPKGDIEIH